MTKQVIVIGSINMDIVVDTARMPVMGETISGSDVHYFLGGKGANQAVAAARWAHQSDVEVHFFGCVGNDAFGEAARHQLAKEPLQLHVTTDVCHATGIAIIQHVDSDNAIIVVPGANDTVTCTEEMLSTMHAGDVLLLQHEIPITTVIALLQAAKERGLTTIVNPAPYQDAITELLPWIDLITPNETEAAGLLGIPTLPDNPESLLLDFYRTYQTDICLTLGDNGVAWVDAKDIMN